MKRVLVSAMVAAALGAAGVAPAAQAADMAVKAPKLVAPVPVSPFDIGFGAAVMNDYIFRGISQSNQVSPPGARYSAQERWVRK